MLEEQTTAPPALHDRDAVTREGLIAGVRAGLPFALAGGLLAVSFGVVAEGAGLSEVAAIVMSAVVFAGAAQFAAIAILAQGGAVGAAIVAAALMNSRYLAMGLALAPSVRGRLLGRALQAQPVVDASWALAARADGTFDRSMLFGATVPQYLAWVGGTVAGALGGGFLADPERYGLDAIYPAFFLGLLLAELRNGRARGVAAAGALIALVLIPFAPPGVPILAASVAALAGLTHRARAEMAESLERAG